MAAWMGTLRLLFCAASTPKMARPRARAMRKMPRPTPATSAMVVGCPVGGFQGLGLGGFSVAQTVEVARRFGLVRVGCHLSGPVVNRKRGGRFGGAEGADTDDAGPLWGPCGAFFAGPGPRRFVREAIKHQSNYYRRGQQREVRRGGGMAAGGAWDRVRDPPPQ